MGGDQAAYWHLHRRGQIRGQQENYERHAACLGTSDPEEGTLSGRPL
jgi:hypothetical protein